MPLKVIKRTSIPPPLKLQRKSSSIGRAIRLSSSNTYSIIDSPLNQQSSYTSARNSRSNILANSCAFCDELLSVNFSGERTLQLECSHQCHKVCLLTMMEGSTSYSCNICENVTKFQIDKLHDNNIGLGNLSQRSYINSMISDGGIDEEDRPMSMLTDDALSLIDMAPSSLEYTSSSVLDFDAPYTKFSCMDDGPKTPSDQMIPETLMKPPATTTTIKQLISPDHSFHNSINVYEDITKPTISCLTNIDKITLSDMKNDPIQSIDCLLNIKAPSIFNGPDITNEETFLASSVIDEFKQTLARINNDSSLLDFHELGDLWLVDVFNMSTNGITWDPVICFLFNNALIIIDQDNEKIVGKIMINEDVANFNKLNNTILLNLTNDLIPELQIQNSHFFIIEKWNHYLSESIKNKLVTIPLFHLTSNCWQFVRINDFKLPPNIQSFKDCIQNNYEIPTSLLIQAVPRPDSLPLNLIVSVCLINNVRPPISNDEYKQNLVATINSLRNSLNPNDKFGLVTVGLSNTNKNGGSFTGCVEASWSGWDSVINSIQILPNRTIDHNQFYSNGYEELLSSFTKCKELSPFIPNGTHYNNKLIIIQANDYTLDDKVNNNAAERLYEKIEYIKESTNIFVDLIRVGEHYNDELKTCQKMISQPKISSESNTMDLTYGTRLIRYDDFKQFGDSIPELIENFQKICIPSITIDLKKLDFENHEIVEFNQIEINGEMINVSMKDLKNMRIKLNNILPKSEKNIMIKLRLNFSDMQISTNQKFIQFPIFDFQSQWINEHDEKIIDVKILQANRTSTQYAFQADPGSLSPPTSISLFDQDPYYKDVPLLPPLAPTKDQNFTKRQIELAIIESMNMISSNFPDQTNSASVEKAIKVVRNLMPGLNLDSNMNFDHNELTDEGENAAKNNRNSLSSIERVHKNNQDYIQYIIDELKTLKSNFQNHTAYSVTSCYDLANWLL